MPNPIRICRGGAHGRYVNLGCGVPAGTGAPVGLIRDLHHLCYTA